MSDEDIALIPNTDLRSKITKDRYNIWKNGYKFDRWIFQLTMFAIFGLLFFIAYSNDFQLNYYQCGSPGAAYPYSNLEECKNPFYKPASWVNEEYLPPGEYGFKGSFLFNNIWLICIGLFILAAILNHLIYNRRLKRYGSNKTPWK